MKNKLLIGVLSAGVILGGALVVGAESNNNGETNVQKVTESKVEGYVEGKKLNDDRDDKNQSTK